MVELLRFRGALWLCVGVIALLDLNRRFHAFRPRAFKKQFIISDPIKMLGTTSSLVYGVAKSENHSFQNLSRRDLERSRPSLKDNHPA